MKITIDFMGIVEVIINIVVRYHGLLELIISDYDSLFISKFLFLLCYFLDIKCELSTTFHPQRNDLIERQNSTIKTYLQAFDN